MRNRLGLRLLLLAALVAAAAWGFVHFDLGRFFADREQTIRLLKSYGALSVMVFILLQVLQVILAPIPGEVTGFIGGYLYGPVLGTLYSTIGLTLGSWLAFGLAHWFGLPLVERFVRPSLVRKYDNFMAHQGTAVAFFLFLIPGFPKDSLCYILGLSHMKVGPFLVVCTVGRLLGTIGLSISGMIARDPCRANIPWMIALAAGSLLFLLAYFWRREIIRHVRRIRPPEPPGGSA
jgi:uncharacterized membrane protein YdjX (TVP38/TMEM64 family)